MFLTSVELLGFNESIKYYTNISIESCSTTTKPLSLTLYTWYPRGSPLNDVPHVRSRVRQNIANSASQPSLHLSPWATLPLIYNCMFCLLIVRRARSCFGWSSSRFKQVGLIGVERTDQHRALAPLRYCTFAVWDCKKGSCKNLSQRVIGDAVLIARLVFSLIVTVVLHTCTTATTKDVLNK